MINNSININKTNDYNSPQIIDHKKTPTTYVDGNPGPIFRGVQMCCGNTYTQAIKNLPIHFHWKRPYTITKQNERLHKHGDYQFYQS